MLKMLDKCLIFGAILLISQIDKTKSVDISINSNIYVDYSTGKSSTASNEVVVTTPSDANKNIEKSFGANLINSFTEAEKKVHKFIKEKRLKDYDFLQKKTFFQLRDHSSEEQLLTIIAKIPKGALLHAHSTGMVSQKWIKQTISAQASPNFVYKCDIGEDRRKYSIYTFKLADNRCPGAKTEKLTAGDRITDLDMEDNSDPWTKIKEITNTLSGFIGNKRIYGEYHKQLLTEIYEDKIMYAELRTSFSGVFEETAPHADVPETKVLEILKPIIDQFKTGNTGFLGVKFIYTVDRKLSKEEMVNKIKIYKDLKNLEIGKELIIGFDLVGRESKGNPLSFYSEELKELPSDTQYYFHAGESTTYDKDVDKNLEDVIAEKNTKRIGHGLALTRYPKLQQNAKDKKIALEICPISNHIFKLEGGQLPAVLLAQNILPVVIGTDYPGYWQSKLSFDLYYAFVKFAHSGGGLEVLKQFALNSINYNSLSDADRKTLKDDFDSKWSVYITDMVTTYSLT